MKQSTIEHPTSSVSPGDAMDARGMDLHHSSPGPVASMEGDVSTSEAAPGGGMDTRGIDFHHSSPGQVASRAGGLSTSSAAPGGVMDARGTDLHHSLPGPAVDVGKEIPVPKGKFGSSVEPELEHGIARQVRAPAPKAGPTTLGSNAFAGKRGSARQVRGSATSIKPTWEIPDSDEESGARIEAGSKRGSALLVRESTTSVKPKSSGPNPIVKPGRKRGSALQVRESAPSVAPTWENPGSDEEPRVSLEPGRTSGSARQVREPAPSAGPKVIQVRDFSKEYEPGRMSGPARNVRVPASSTKPVALGESSTNLNRGRVIEILSSSPSSDSDPIVGPSQKRRRVLPVQEPATGDEPTKHTMRYAVPAVAAPAGKRRRAPRVPASASHHDLTDQENEVLRRFDRKHYHEVKKIARMRASASNLRPTVPATVPSGPQTSRAGSVNAAVSESEVNVEVHVPKTFRHLDPSIPVNGPDEVTPEPSFGQGLSAPPLKRPRIKRKLGSDLVKVEPDSDFELHLGSTGSAKRYKPVSDLAKFEPDSGFIKSEPESEFEVASDSAGSAKRYKPKAPKAKPKNKAKGKGKAKAKPKAKGKGKSKASEASSDAQSHEDEEERDASSESEWHEDVVDLIGLEDYEDDEEQELQALAEQLGLEIDDEESVDQAGSKVEGVEDAADPPQGATSEDNIKCFDEEITKMVDCLRNYAKSIEPRSDPEFSWAAQPMSRPCWSFLGNVNRSHLVKTLLEAVPDRVKDVLGRKKITAEDLLSLPEGWQGEKEPFFYLDLVTMLRASGTPKAWPYGGSASKLDHAYARILYCMRVKAGTGTARPDELLSAHLRRALDDLCKMNIRALAHFRRRANGHRIDRRYVLLMETILIIWLRSFTFGRSTPYTPPKRENFWRKSTKRSSFRIMTGAR